MREQVVNAAAEQPNLLIPALPDLVWATVCFVVILVFFMWKVLPRFQAMLDERAEAIEGNIARADDAQNRAQALLEQYTAQLADARAEAAQIREKAREDGKQIIAELKESAAVEAARITATAQAQIEAERQAAIISLRSEVGSLAIDLASGVVGESLTDDQRSASIVDRFLADLEASEAQKAGSAK